MDSGFAFVDRKSGLTCVEHHANLNHLTAIWQLRSTDSAIQPAEQIGDDSSARGLGFVVDLME